MKNRRYEIWAGLLLAAKIGLAVPYHPTAAFTDNFDSLGNGVALETSGNWTKISGNSFIGRSDGGVSSATGATAMTIVNPSVISYTEKQNFTLTYDIKIGDGNASGVAFGYQNPTNYYLILLNENGQNVAFQKKVNGTISNIVSPGSLSLVIGQIYRLHVAYIADTDVFNYSVETLSNSTTVYSNSVTNSQFTSGGFGIYVHYSEKDVLDNFSVSVASPGALGLFLVQ